MAWMLRTTTDTGPADTAAEGLVVMVTPFRYSWAVSKVWNLR
jgi:hypothetical protein